MYGSSHETPFIYRYLLVMQMYLELNGRSSVCRYSLSRGFNGIARVPSWKKKTNKYTRKSILHSFQSVYLEIRGFGLHAVR